MDQTTLQVYSVLFVSATAVLVYTARFLGARRGKRRQQRRLTGLERLPAWTGRAVEAGRPLHLGFGSAGVGEDNTAVALANAEFFYHIIQGASAGDASPVLTTSAAATVPLAQDTLRRAWRGGDFLARAQWTPQGPRSLAYAAAISATTGADEPAAHILAGSFGPELALMLDSAARRSQPSLAVSDQLAGQAVAYAMADECLIGEELFAAPGYVADGWRAGADAVVMDVWRGLLIMGLAAALLLEATKGLPWFSWPLLALLAALIIIGVVVYRRR